MKKQDKNRETDLLKVIQMFCPRRTGSLQPLSSLNYTLRAWLVVFKPFLAASEKLFRGHWEIKSVPDISLSPEFLGDDRDSDLSDRSLSTPPGSSHPTLHTLNSL